MPLPPTWNCCNPFIWNRRQCDLRQSNRENIKNSHSIGFYFGFNPIRLVFQTGKPLINHARTPNNIRARTHTRRRKISTTRPPIQHNTLCVCCLRGWSITLTRGIRPPFDHQVLYRCHHRNSPTGIATNTRFCMFWRPTTPLSNVGQDYCIIFDVTLFRYLKQLFCLVWRVFTESSGTGSSTLKSEPMRCHRDWSMASRIMHSFWVLRMIGE